MDDYTKVEQAYKNGYAAGKRDAVKHGRWFRTGAENVYGGIEIQCSECRRTLMSSPGHIDEECFCCYCGARMDGDQ